MRTFAIAMIVGAFFTIWGLFMSGPAEAAPHNVTTEVEWGGSWCIRIDTWSLGTRIACNPNQTYVLLETDYHPGSYVGGDPVMGSASWIECRVYVDGVLDYTDFAVSGDGTDVNCSRELFEYGGYAV